MLSPKQNTNVQKVKKAMAVNQTAENKIKTEAGLTEALAYITNPAKISEVSLINCSGSNSNTLDQFRLLRLAFNQNNGIISHHFIQSFSPNDNVTPETVHRFGVEYAKLCFPNYQVVVSTHVDKEHLHNHIIVNSCNMITGRKYYDNKETMKNNRAISDKLCRKYGVSVISSKSEFKPIDQTTMQLALKHKSWKIQLLSDLDEAKESCKSKSEFISFLKNKNYEVRYEKHITVHKIGEKKAIRVDTLAKQFGSQYTKAELEKAMGYSTNLADTNTSNLNLQSKKTCARKNINEWQRFESWSFSQDNRYANNYRCLTKQYRTNYHTSRFPTGTRKSILFTILCALFISPNRKKYREHKSYPFDLEAIRQVIIDDAINNYGLVLAEDSTPDDSSWFPPLVIWKGVNPNVIRMRVSEQAESSYTGGHMKSGHYFNVYIETIPDLKKDENGNSIEGYAIYFLRGGPSRQ